MKNRYSQRAALLVTTLSLVLMIAMLLPCSGYGQAQPTQKRTIQEGQPTTIKGVIISRDGETFVVRDMSRTDTTVVLTDSTKIRTERKGLLRGNKAFDVTALLPGLILQVKGKGDPRGDLVADDITFTESDLKAAVTASVRTAPVEKKSDEALRDIADTNKRIASLDEFDLVKTVTVLFPVNSAKLGNEQKAQLDELASKAPDAKNYMVEVQGFADRSGNFDKNLQLSQRRADAVVQYLTVKHNIPLRRITTPMGYGSTKPAGDEGTASGREQSRRVEVRVLVNKGLNK